MMVGCGVGAKVGARPAQGAATTTEEGLVQDVRMWLGCGGCSLLVRRLRTLERASLLGWMMVGCGVGAKVGARPAQGAATTTDVDLRVECG